VVKKPDGTVIARAGGVIKQLNNNQRDIRQPVKQTPKNVIEQRRRAVSMQKAANADSETESEEESDYEIINTSGR
jgi:hypothetical protein